MKELFASLVLVLSGTVFPGRALGQSDPKAAPQRIGQIFIVGNTITRQDVILGAIKLYPGQVLRRADLRKAEKDLERLGLFAMDPSTGIRPTVTIIDSEGHFRDILVNVQETTTSGVRLMPRLSARGEAAISVVWEERNCDPLNWPASIDDLTSGGAFRGAGRLFRVELLRVPVLPSWLRCVFQFGGLFDPAEFPGVLIPLEYPWVITSTVKTPC